MQGHALTNIFLTRDELVFEFLTLKDRFPECIVQFHRSNEYVHIKWDDLQSNQRTRYICACYAGVASRMPFKVGWESPYLFGCICCSDPLNYRGYVSESEVSWTGREIEDEQLRLELQREYRELVKRLKRRCRQYIRHNTEDDSAKKVYISEKMLEEIQKGTKICQSIGPDRVYAGKFYIETEIGQVRLH